MLLTARILHAARPLASVASFFHRLAVAARALHSGARAPASTLHTDEAVTAAKRFTERAHASDDLPTAPTLYSAVHAARAAALPLSHPDLALVVGNLACAQRAAGAFERR